MSACPPCGGATCPRAARCGFVPNAVTIRNEHPGRMLCGGCTSSMRTAPEGTHSHSMVAGGFEEMS
jgi:hypothetical protein